ncbi:F-box protein PP2-B10-like [Carex rostrata]
MKIAGCGLVIGTLISTIPHTLFSEVALLLAVRQLEVKATIYFQELLPETNYAVYLIFKTTPDSEGLDLMQNALVYMDECEWTRDVCVNPTVLRPLRRCNVYPVNRLTDGWMELELGQFYCDGGMGEVR